jgi:group I intron endonuclease
MAFVYLHTNLENGKVYVGQTQQKPADRWTRHCYDAMKGARGCRLFSDAIRKYGPEAFDQQVLGEMQTQSEIDNLEKIWIILLQATNHQFGYNLQAGGSGTRRRQSEATKKIISEYQKTHDNAGRFRAGVPPLVHYLKGHVPWNAGKSMKHSGSFGVGHRPYCNHLGGYRDSNTCSRCGKEKSVCA